MAYEIGAWDVGNELGPCGDAFIVSFAVWRFGDVRLIFPASPSFSHDGFHFLQGAAGAGRALLPKRSTTSCSVSRLGGPTAAKALAVSGRVAALTLGCPSGSAGSADRPPLHVGACRPCWRPACRYRPALADARLAGGAESTVSQTELYSTGLRKRSRGGVDAGGDRPVRGRADAAGGAHYPSPGMIETGREPAPRVLDPRGGKAGTRLACKSRISAVAACVGTFADERFPFLSAPHGIKERIPDDRSRLHPRPDATMGELRLLLGVP